MNAPLLWDNVPSWTPELRAKIPGKMALLAAEMQKGGWQAILNSFKKYAEEN